MKGTVHYDKHGDVAVLRIDNPPVNPLSDGVRQGMFDGFNKALADDEVKAVVLTGEGRAFIAGADISEFGKPASDAPSITGAWAAILAGNKPVVAAINATAFGGGLETALLCDYRIALSSAQVGLPEVKLGLLPGAGGTQRVPRLAGAKAALDMIMSGDPVPAAKALEMGLVDEVVNEDVVGRAVEFAREVADKPRRKVDDIEDVVAQDRGKPEIFEEARKKAASRMRGQFAPEMIIQCVEAAVNSPDFETGMQKEQELFMKCMTHPQREAMIHVFFNERNVGKIPGIGKDTPKKTITSGAVVGGGLMGGGIAMCFANAGMPVKILEVSQEALDKGMETIRKNYATSVRRGRISQQEMDECLARFSGTVNYEDLGDADVVIEAVYENQELKNEIFGKLDKVMKPGAILATNTSGLNVDQMADQTSRPEDMIGMHFFSPANVMRLLEVVRGAKSSPETIATVMALGKTLGKIAVLSENAPGFIGNRMIAGYSGQAREIILQGALPAQVDQVLTRFGMPMGPFQMADMVGLDLGWRAAKMRNQTIDDQPDSGKIAFQLCEMERFGQKNGKGFYLYEEGSRVPRPDPEVDALVISMSKEMGYERREIDDEEVLKRIVYALVNIGAQLLDDKIALRPGDIDIVYINGYGFPAYRGGPMHYADTVGVKEVYEDICRFQEEYGDFWKPAPLLKRLAEEGKSFASLQG